MSEKFTSLIHLFERLHRDFLGYLASKGVPERDREDLIHETMINAIKQWRREVPQKPELWLFHSLKNVRRNYVRSLNTKKRRGLFASLDEALQVPTATPSPHQQLMAAESVRRLLSCIGKLPPTLKQLLAFKSFQNMTIEEIAKVMDTKEGTIKSRTHSARKLIEACLQEDKVGAEPKPEEIGLWESCLQDALAHYAAEEVRGQTHLSVTQLYGLIERRSGVEPREQLMHHLAFCLPCLNHYHAMKTAFGEEQVLPPLRWDWRPLALCLAAGLVLGLVLSPLLYRPAQQPLSNLKRFELRADAVRGRTKIVLERQHDALDLTIPLRLDHPYTGYRLVLERDGVAVVSQSSMTFEAGALALILPRGQVPEGDIHLLVYGKEGTGEALLARYELTVSIDP